jgi:hypothetical protein
VIADIQSVLRHHSATTTAKYIKSLGREVYVLLWKHYLSKRVWFFTLRPLEITEGKNPSEKEKAVSGAVNF